MKNDRFLRACRRQPVDCTPVWFMRQAGRYQAEYRAIREKHSLLEICYQPELAARVTLLPVQQLGVDAAILFSDIMVPLAGMGVGFDLVENVGPVVREPIRSAAQADRIHPLDPEGSVPFVMDAIRILRRELPVPLIGFSGGPFTLASYLIEGRGSRTFARTKQFMHAESAAWHRLMERLAAGMAAYLQAQAQAGAQALQIFDSWVGALDEADYREFVLPHMQGLFRQLAGLDVPVIHFGVGTAHLLPVLAEAGGDVIGVDWRTPMDVAWRQVGTGHAVQGNLDPAVLLGPRDRLEARVRDIIRRVAGRPGHIFNLGHGVLPETSPEVLRRVVELVHAETANKEASR